MWQVNNQTPYSTAATWVRDKDGAHRWNVVAKATFDLAETTNLQLADEQPAPLLLPEYRGEDGSTSLHFEADLAAMKPATDVLVDGRAYAPNAEPQREVPIALRFANVEKTLVARGPSVYYDGPLGLATTSPELFEQMPITYERAFGGQDWTCDDPRTRRFDPRNPVGVGFKVRATNEEHRAGPNVVYPGRAPAKTGPAGFGPIASHWAPRSQYAGTYDAAWIRDRKPLLPKDYDDRFMLCAPADQRATEYLGAGDRIEIVNMTREGVLRFDVPPVNLRMITHFGSRREEHGVNLVTVLVDTEAPRVALVWQSELLVTPRRVAQLDETKVVEA